MSWLPALRHEVRLGPWLAIVLLACGGDCSCRRGCGEGGSDGASAVNGPGSGVAGAGVPGAPGPGPGPGAAGADAPTATGSAGGTATGAGAGAETKLEVLGELIAAPTLRAVLPGSVGNLRAAAPTLDGPAQHERRPVRNVSRRYKDGKRDLYVEIIDTAQAPELRANVEKMLIDPAAVQAPVREPIMVAGSTGLTTGFPAQRASGVMALLGGRYFVNARLEGSDDMQEAARLLQAMDWSALTANAGGDGTGAH